MTYVEKLRPPKWRIFGPLGRGERPVQMGGALRTLFTMACLRQGVLHRTIHVLERAPNVCRAATLQPHGHRSLGKLLRRVGRRDEARAELATAKALLREIGVTFWLPEAERELVEATG